MLDGIQNDSHYPADFFVDLVFKELGEEVKEKEEKNKVWQTIAKDCEEKRKLAEEEDALLLNAEDVKNGEEEAFVIESEEIIKPNINTEENSANLEQEAIRMHKELLEDDVVEKTESEAKAEVHKAEDTVNKGEVKAATEGEEQKEGLVEGNSEKKQESNVSKSEEKRKSKNVEGGKQEDVDEDIDLLLSGIQKMIGKCICSLSSYCSLLLLLYVQA
eukprot:TRINITY_DN8672_c0_g1_i1.p1 TRINITY_DN8672_c0_g1~~TRINITY_DN8672_c0_g1_i1.p1  ORF type:complete len:217 (-),score=57.34 TRINITY_DN8672_c0_g1_i1:14-664(-)